jgi:hypothetical protein
LERVADQDLRAGVGGQRQQRAEVVAEPRAALPEDRAAFAAEDVPGDAPAAQRIRPAS